MRKAIMAGVGAAGASLWAGLQGDTPDNSTEWAGLIGTAVAAAVVVGYGTWRIENART